MLREIHAKSELKALEILLNAGVKNTIIPKDSGLIYSYFSKEYLLPLYQANLQHFGPMMLKNKINYPSTTLGEITYRYALALVRVLEEYSQINSQNWAKDLFPLIFETSSKDKVKEEFFKKIDSDDLTHRLLALIKLSEDEIATIYRDTLNEYLSNDERQIIKKKIESESDLDKFPFEEGWTYKIEAGKFISTYFDWINGVSYADKKTMQKMAYLKGLAKLETADKQMIIENISIPIVVMIFNGKIRFKDIGNTLENGNFMFGDKEGDVYKTLTLEIKGLTFKAKNVSVQNNKREKETIITLR